MARLFVFDEKVESIFQLLGEKENDISYSVGYALANCKEFLARFLRQLNVSGQVNTNKVVVKLQTHERQAGFTDFEIFQEGLFYFIVEAKKGWNFPAQEQLRKYAGRQKFQSAIALDKRIIVFNESTAAYTQARFGVTEISSMPVSVLSWKLIQHLAISSIKAGRDVENRLLRDLSVYLQKISTMQKIDSNWVYIVSLSWDKPSGWELSFQDIVNIKQRYFHPVGGGGWPTEPPNYIAFRYGGKLQSIHHIDSYEVFTNPSLHFPELPSDTWKPHYLYRLGPAMKPSREVKSGKKIIRNLRVWAMLDLLLTSSTIEEARDKSNIREAVQPLA